MRSRKSRATAACGRDRHLLTCTKGLCDKNALYGLFLKAQTWEEPKCPPPGEA